MRSLLSLSLGWFAFLMLSLGSLFADTGVIFNHQTAESLLSQSVNRIYQHVGDFTNDAADAMKKAALTDPHHKYSFALFRVNVEPNAPKFKVVGTPTVSRGRNSTVTRIDWEMTWGGIGAPPQFFASLRSGQDLTPRGDALSSAIETIASGSAVFVVPASGDQVHVVLIGAPQVSSSFSILMDPGVQKNVRPSDVSGILAPYWNQGCGALMIKRVFDGIGTPLNVGLDVTGSWNLTLTLSNGTRQAIAMQLSQIGDQVVGTANLAGQAANSLVVAGNITHDGGAAKIHFTVKFTAGGSLVATGTADVTSTQMRNGRMVLAALGQTLSFTADRIR